MRNRGEHGYDHEAPPMAGMFVAAGPAFRRGVEIPAFQTVHVYALLAHLLGVSPAPNEGTLDSLRLALRPGDR